MKKKSSFIIVSIFLICFLLFFSCKKQIESPTYEENKTIETVSTSKNLKDELLNNSFDNNDLTLNDINNVDKLNGFRCLKLGSDINIYDFKNYAKDYNYFSDKFSEINIGFNNKTIKISNGYVWHIELNYVKNKLKLINIKHSEMVVNDFDINSSKYVTDYSKHSLLNLYINIFGKPSKVMLFDDDHYFTYPLKECSQNDYQTCFSEFCNTTENLGMLESNSISFIWITKSVIYELILTSNSLMRNGKKEEDEKNKCYEKGIPYYSSEQSVIRIYPNESNILEDLKSLRTESFTIQAENEKNLKAKTHINDI